MAPKIAKGAAKKKETELLEPEHDPTWQRAVDSGVWDRPPPTLPDANIWPTWGAVRERVLTACRELRIVDCPALRDAFPAELVKLSPPELAVVDFQGAANLTRFVLSPITACAKLASLDLSRCAKLAYVLIQSDSLQTLNLSGCPALTKVVLQCSKLERLSMRDCPALDTLLLWSESLAEMDLSESKGMAKMQLHCPALLDENCKLPPLRRPPPQQRPPHAPVAAMLKEQYQEQQVELQAVEEATRRAAAVSTTIARPFRPFF